MRLHTNVTCGTACEPVHNRSLNLCLAARMTSTSSTQNCRLCRDLVASNRAVSLFSVTGSQHQWPSRIENLLSVPVSDCDGLSSYICQKCKVRIVSLEKAAADLKAFKELASCSRSALERVRGPLKRPKCTSSDIGVSPDTARKRPRSKLSRKRLEFNSEMQTSNSLNT